MQDLARDLLGRELVKKRSGKMKPHRVVACLRVRLPGKLREVWKSFKSKRAHYKNLVLCGDVWACPVCAAKVAERRRAELVQAFLSADGLGLTPIFITFTLRHKKDDTLPGTLKALLRAYSRLKSGKAWAGFCERFGLVGDVRALETTWRKLNGWHPHIHAVFFARSTDIAKMRTWLRDHWVKRVGSTGKSAIGAVGVVVEVGHEAISNYLNKHGSGWGLEDELARGVSKVARGKKGFSPFALLREFGSGKEWAGALFIEYTKAFKGKSQLRFSRKLRGLLQIGPELTDAEVASLPETESVYLASILDKEWALIERFRARGNLLEIATASGVDGIKVFLDVLRARAENGERGE